MKIEYAEHELAHIIGTVRVAENTDEMPKMCWAIAAKALEALAADRKKLLRRFRDTWEFELVHEKEYPSKGGWIENREKVKVLMSEVAKELGDG